jgi:citronellyl-CoA dehydrogenase
MPFLIRTRLMMPHIFRVGRLLREVTDGCLQYYGGVGFMDETPISRAYRDSRLVSIGAGADEIMLGIIWKFIKAGYDQNLR